MRLLSLYLDVERPVDYLLASDAALSEDVRRRYELNGQHPVKIDEENCGRYVREIVKRPMIGEGFFARHKPAALAAAIMGIMESDEGAEAEVERAEEEERSACVIS